MTVVVRPDILSSLKSVREDVQRQVAELDRYRALKAIEQTIADFPSLEDFTRSLSEVRDAVQRQLDDTREYRALRTIERIMPELSEVLDLVAERADRQPATVTSDPHGFEPIPEPVEPPAVVDWHANATAEAAPDIVEVHTIEASPAAAPTDPEPLAIAAALHPEAAAATPESGPQDDTEHPHAPQVPSLADSVAQLMAQSASSTPKDTQTPRTLDDSDGDTGAAGRSESRTEQAA